ncbi:unnamed protein product [Cyprideis torosa]|uniref:Uncharacterized protein n=1 Tax=Cyprideis torosa TaxID=163714 RepID=A0A7R8WCI1_9CRUS|nr:unnamed protein product [Cyprideis torosa]CAG0887418.1 unnamed protein product [Cyprideis torosa]
MDQPLESNPIWYRIAVDAVHKESVLLREEFGDFVTAKAIDVFLKVLDTTLTLTIQWGAMVHQDSPPPSEKPESAPMVTEDPLEQPDALVVSDSVPDCGIPSWPEENLAVKLEVTEEERSSSPPPVVVKDSTCAKELEDSSCTKNLEDSSCTKELEDSCTTESEDFCTEQSQQNSSCTKESEDSCAKESEDSCTTESEDFCTKQSQKNSSCTKDSEDSCTNELEDSSCTKESEDSCTKELEDSSCAKESEDSSYSKELLEDYSPVLESPVSLKRSLRRTKRTSMSSVDPESGLTKWQLKYKQEKEANKTYTCEHCGEVFRSRPKYYQHRRTHRGGIKCTLCGTLVLPERMDAHMDKHANDPEIKCTECERSFKNRRDYQNHIQRYHKPENWVVCDMCGKSVYKFFMRSHLETHKFKDPNFVPPEDYRCKLCGTPFASDTRLALHMKSVHKPPDLICSHCGKAFKYKKQFVEHEAMHTGTNLYTCDKCGEGFVKAEKLRIHKRKHDNIRPHQCNYCEKAFFDKFALSQHINSHTGERPFVCKYCGLSYTASGSMHTHIRIKHKWDGKRYDARRRKKVRQHLEDGMQEHSLPAHIPHDDSSMSTTGF